MVDVSRIDTDRTAVDGAGHRVADILVMDTAGGLTPHLVSSDDRERTLCGRVPSHLSRTWFDVTGCAKCRRVAANRGIASITDVDGRVITI